MMIVKADICGQAMGMFKQTFEGRSITLSSTAVYYATKIQHNNEKKNVDETNILRKYLTKIVTCMVRWFFFQFNFLFFNVSNFYHIWFFLWCSSYRGKKKKKIDDPASFTITHTLERSEMT